ncbi:MAG TPA: substrate-binding domain-containing protein [Clostridia bacterium]|nr:substrate-binding domain-containing protein [Clostridia bacterium]
MKQNDMLRKVILIFLLFILVLLFYFVMKQLDIIDIEGYFSKKTFEQNDDRLVIGFSLGTLKEERWLKDRDILIAKVKEMGADIIVQNANNDDQDQLKQVKYLLEQNIDVLIIVPNDLEKASNAVELAKRQGVKVISYDRLVMKSNADLYISFDNEKVGELMAKYVSERLDKGNILIVNGANRDHNTKMIKQGYDRVLSDRIKSGNIEIIAEEWADNWMKEYAFEETVRAIQEGKSIDGVIAGNDSLAEGVIEALSEHRMAGKVYVVGQDADLSACQRIVERTQLMTVYKPIEKLAGETARLAVMLAKGESLNIKKTIYDGRFDIPYYELEPIPVDKENIDTTIIKDGFHMKEEVYRN